MLDKFFDFIFDLPLIKIFKPFYLKHKDIVLYVFFGVLTTIVSFFTYWLFLDVFNLHELIANTISWIFAVGFAFFTNRVWVFNCPTKGQKSFLIQMLKFYSGRLFTLGVEDGIIFIFVTKLEYNELLIKLFATIIVLILNYIISKVIIFRKKHEHDKI